MAEAIGLIASVIQVAGTGLKLSQTLYQYADGVATADRRIKDIAKEIELTSFVIDELGSIFKQEETSILISKNAVKTANETMKECSNVFAEIDATLKKSKKGKMGRLMLPFRDNKIELLRNHINKLKSTLQLLMQVLTHAHQVSSRKLDREAEAKQREEIRQLLENNKKFTKRYEESLRNFSISDVSTVVHNDEDSDKEDNDTISTAAFSMATKAIGSTIDSETLLECVDHIQNLLGDIETLQQALAKKVDGYDHSDQHQSVVGSYLLARGHLDSVLLGSSNGLDVLKSQSVDQSTVVQAKIGEDAFGIQRTMTECTLNHTASEGNPLTDAEFGKALQKAKEKEKIRQKFERTQAERDRVQQRTLFYENQLQGHRLGERAVEREVIMRGNDRLATSDSTDSGTKKNRVKTSSFASHSTEAYEISWLERTNPENRSSIPAAAAAPSHPCPPLARIVAAESLHVHPPLPGGSPKLSGSSNIYQRCPQTLFDLPTSSPLLPPGTPGTLHYPPVHHKPTQRTTLANSSVVVDEVEILLREWTTVSVLPKQALVLDAFDRR